MTDKTERRTPRPPRPTLVHMTTPPPRTPGEEARRETELVIAKHFRAQNEILEANRAEQNAQLREQSDQMKEQREMISRLTNGIEQLVGEMHGIRTGKKTEAFARIAGADARPDLPTVSAESALFYTLTSTKIGAELGFHASQIGALLGSRGLKWAGNGDYQEIGRDEGTGAKKYWHREVPERLRKILDENDPTKHGIWHGSVMAIFNAWSLRREGERLLEDLASSNPQ